MSKRLKEAFEKLSLSAPFQDQFGAWKKTWHVIVPGQAMRLAKYDNNYVFPELARNHLSNLADGFMVAGIVNMLQMAACAVTGKDVKSRPILSAAFGMAVLAAHECMLTYPPHHNIDWVDMGLHAGSILAYLAYNYRDSLFPRKAEESSLHKGP